MEKAKETRERVRTEKENPKNRVISLQKLKMVATKVNVAQGFIES